MKKLKKGVCWVQERATYKGVGESCDSLMK